jgi:hypothetical protein
MWVLVCSVCLKKQVLIKLIFIPEGIKDTVSEEFEQRICYQHKTLKRRLENDDKRLGRKEASVAVN